MSDKAAAQSSGRGSARERSTSKAVAREALREDLDAISRTARALALNTPGLDDKFRLPRSNGDQALLSAARASIDAALDSGLSAVRLLDAIVPNRLRNDSATIAVWERARHVEYPAARGKSETPAHGVSPTVAAPATT